MTLVGYSHSLPAGNSKHNKILIPKTAELNNHNFLIRMLYRDCY